MGIVGIVRIAGCGREAGDLEVSFVCTLLSSLTKAGWVTGRHFRIFARGPQHSCWYEYGYGVLLLVLCRPRGDRIGWEFNQWLAVVKTSKPLVYSVVICA